jgi:hypothetical protein
VSRRPLQAQVLIYDSINRATIIYMLGDWAAVTGFHNAGFNMVDVNGTTGYIDSDDVTLEGDCSAFLADEQ